MQTSQANKTSSEDRARVKIWLLWLLSFMQKINKIKLRKHSRCFVAFSHFALSTFLYVGFSDMDVYCYQFYGSKAIFIFEIVLPSKESISF